MEIFYFFLKENLLGLGSGVLVNLFELDVSLPDDPDDPGVGVQDDEHGDVEGAARGVDDIADVLVVVALGQFGAVAIGIRPEKGQKIFCLS